MRYYWFFGVHMLLVGCGDGLNVVPVSGVVTLDDKPLIGAGITTQPMGQGTRTPGPGSFATTDAEGHFELELVKPARKGAIVGTHRVFISPKYSNLKQSGTRSSADGSYTYGVDEPLSRRVTDGGESWPARFTDGSVTLEVAPEGNNEVRFDLKRP